MTMSWKILQEQNPELAAYGYERLHYKVAYLATVRADGAPRVHPVTPIIGEGHLLLFMEPTSPKGRDLERDSRYAMHCSVNDNSGGGGEFVIAGRAFLTTDADLRTLAARVGYPPKDRYLLFECEIDRAASTNYENGQVIRRQWMKEG